MPSGRPSPLVSPFSGSLPLASSTALEMPSPSESSSPSMRPSPLVSLACSPLAMRNAVSAVMPASVLTVLASLTAGSVPYRFSWTFGMPSPSSSLTRSGWSKRHHLDGGVLVRAALGGRRDVAGRARVGTSTAPNAPVAVGLGLGLGLRSCVGVAAATDDHGHGRAAAGAAAREADRRQRRGAVRAGLARADVAGARLDVGRVRLLARRLGHRERPERKRCARARTSSPSSRRAARRAPPGRGFQRRGRWRSCLRGAGLRARRAAVRCAWCQCPTLVSIPIHGEVSASCTRSISPIGRNDGFERRIGQTYEHRQKGLETAHFRTLRIRPEIGPLYEASLRNRARTSANQNSRRS